MIVRIQDIKIGDTIKESRGSGIEVTRLDFVSCSTGGVHVNGNACYEWNDRVERKIRVSDEEASEPTVADILRGEADMPEPDTDSLFSDKALMDKLRRQAREIAYS